MSSTSTVRTGRAFDPRLLVVAVIVLLGLAAAFWKYEGPRPTVSSSSPPLQYQRRQRLDSSGLKTVIATIEPWNPLAPLSAVAEVWQNVGYRKVEEIERQIAAGKLTDEERLGMKFTQAVLYNYQGQPKRAYELLGEIRSEIERHPTMAQVTLYTLIYYQGLTAFRRGETENCVLCIGDSSCILPLAPSAIHTKPTGSRLAIQHFTEYLDMFPDDHDVRWLLNLAHMTLGEHPTAVDPAYLVDISHFENSEFNIGKFRDVSQAAGIYRVNPAGGAIMDDFNNDGLLDLAITSFDSTVPMALYQNTGNGNFEDRTKASGVEAQLGGPNCMQTDYNNDGYLDIFIVRGGWMLNAMRPTLLRNDGNGTFTDVTAEAGLLVPINSLTASWSDYDNDGWMDLYICCERQASLLFHNEANGTFREVTEAAGLRPQTLLDCKGAAWFDYDNDSYPDLYLNHLSIEGARLFHNNRVGGFEDVTSSMGIDGPQIGFSCWAWDYDNDGWQDIFATCYDFTLTEVVKGMRGEGQPQSIGRLYRNLQGRGFEDQSKAVGLDQQYGTMGSNFGDFDNDGFLDIYLGTGDPQLSALIPNRMFKNVAGQRFSEITGSSRTGLLQKGHAVACGDWDRDGDTDVFIQMGGAVPGDQFHNVLFQNPGQGNHWLVLKLVGQKTNRAAIGARIKVVTNGETPLTIHRHVTSGSSFGGNSLQQTIGVGPADRIALLEIDWPASGTKQVFRDIPINQSLEITELSGHFRTLDWQPTPQPE